MGELSSFQEKQKLSKPKRWNGNIQYSVYYRKLWTPTKFPYVYSTWTAVTYVSVIERAYGPGI